MYYLCKVHTSSDYNKKKQIIKQSCSFFINFTLFLLSVMVNNIFFYSIQYINIGLEYITR